MNLFCYRGTRYLKLVSAVLLTLCLVFSGLQAREPRPGMIDPLTHKVSGEPGEDPHLRTNPEIRMTIDWSGEGAGSNWIPGGDRPGGFERYDPASRLGKDGMSHLDNKWKAIARSLIDLLIR